MVDKDKVLHGLHSCGKVDGIPNICEVTECPYRDPKIGRVCVHELASDAWDLIYEMTEEQKRKDALRVHNIGNVDVPEGVTWEQYQEVMTGVIRALEHTEKGEAWPYGATMD